MPTVHFWTHRSDASTPWDPDAESDLHLSGYGHAFLELYWRLQRGGRNVSIGRELPRDCDVVVISLEEASEWLPRIQPRIAARLAYALLRPRRAPAVVVLRVDLPLSVRSPRYTTLEVMPTSASVEHPRQRRLPGFPQRGLIPRDPRRGDALETVAVKAYSYNVPSWMDASFEQAVRELGYHLRIDTEHDGRWQDFSEVDVVLGTHPTRIIGDERVKPPTKLVNAWRAGAIPVCGSYVGYLEVGRPDEDMIVVDGSREQYLDALARLKREPALGTRIRANGVERAKEYEPRQIADLYWRAFSESKRARRSAIAGELVATSAEALFLKVTRKFRRAS